MRDAVGYWTVRALTGLFGLLPEAVMRRIGMSLGWMVSFVARDRFRMAMRHQRRVSGPAVDARKAARRVFSLYGRYWAEAFWVRPRRKQWMLDNGDVPGLEHLHRVVASGRGLVLALPHLGNWEAAGLRSAAEGARVLAVAEALGNDRIVEWFTDLRNTLDIDIVIARKGGRVTRTLTERLESGGTIALLSDRDLTGRGVPVTFFGEETTLPAGPVAMALRTGATVLPVGCYFRDGAGHTFEVHPPLTIPDGPDTDTRVRLGTQRLAEVMEGIIRRAPEQWHVIIPNWPSDREDGRP